MTQIIDNTGRAHEVKLEMSDYRAALDAGLSLPQHLQNKYQLNAATQKEHGTPFEQALASNNMFIRPDRATGIRSARMSDVLNGSVGIQMGSIVRPDGSDAQTVAGRMLFNALVIEMVESQLADNDTTYEGIFNSLVATTTNSDTPRMDQPIINLTAPQADRSQPIGQGALPPSMATISLSEKSYRLPSFSIGLEITEEAQRATTLDLVTIAVTEQAKAERSAVVDQAIKNMVLGDTDLGMAALATETIETYDSSLSANGVASHKGWLKWLRKDWKKLNIDWVICDLDSYLAIEGRSNRPVVTGNDSMDAGLNVIPKAANPGLPDNVNFFIVETSLLGANMVVGLDSSRAIRKAVYTGAAYQAIEDFVMRRTTAMRIDWSLSYFRLIDQAWKVLLLNAS